MRGLFAASALALLLVTCKPENTNHAPVASAGEDQVTYVHAERAPDGTLIDVFDSVELDGGSSYDPDGSSIVQYFWSFDTIPVGSRLTYEALSPNPDYSPLTHFTPDHEGTYGIVLEVFDGLLLSARDYVQVHVVRSNNTPVADAGPDVNGTTGSPVTLDGSGSHDPDGDFLSYRWELVLVPEDSQLVSADIVYPRTAYPKLTPDAPGVYALSLEVDDGLGGTDDDLVTVTASLGNLPPVVVPGASRTVTPCHDNPITLDGSSSYDPDGDPFTYLWSVTEVPYGSQINSAALTASDEPVTTVQLDRHGLYVFMLTLDDGVNDPSMDVVAILFDDGSSEVPPVAHAGGNQQVQETSSCDDTGCAPCTFRVLLDGTGSYDLNDDPLTYSWELLDGPGELDDPTSPTPELLVASSAPPGPGQMVISTLEVQLVVHDCMSESAPSTAVLTFVCQGA